MEERLVLDARNACVLQMLHVHEASSFCVVLSSIALKRTKATRPTSSRVPLRGTSTEVRRLVILVVLQRAVVIHTMA